jgi:hypothetical protein
MNFVIAMAMRELRASWRRLLFFFLCIGIGTGSIVALRSLIGNVNTAVASEARELLGGDVVVDSTRPWSEQTLTEINRVITSDNRIEARTETLEAPTMVRPPMNRKKQRRSSNSKASNRTTRSSANLSSRAAQHLRRIYWTTTARSSHAVCSNVSM